mgnify:CR=1 FL=1
MSWMRTTFCAAAFAAVATLQSLTGAAAQSIPSEIKLDWAYYSPPALVIRNFGWMDEEFAPEGPTGPSVHIWTFEGTYHEHTDC